ncbi:MAG: hypothetical protein ACXVCP_20070 [Bdellovibrio sp.]
MCAALEGLDGLYNAGKFIVDNNNLTNEYTNKINKLKGDGANTCPENEEQIGQLQLEFVNKQKALVQSYMTPNLGRQALLGVACIAALLSPSP